MLTLGLWLSVVALTDASILFKDDQLHTRSCDVGAIVENECNRCICTLDHVYECLPKTKKCESPVRDTPLCQPSTIYVLNDTVCICNSSGHWPHRQCDSVFKSLVLLKLDTQCEPNTYFIVDCNVCRCGSNGQLDKSHCTKNICDKPQITTTKPKARRFVPHENVYGNCEVQYWYSLAPCQFCYCINENKLVCNTGNSYAHKLELGAYNLSVCGKELIREAMELVPDSQKYLRLGVEATTNTIEAKTPGEIEFNSQVTTIQDLPLKEVNANHEETTQKELNTDYKHNNSYEYYSDSEEHTLIETGSIPSTQLPYNEKEEESTEIKDPEPELESDNETGVEIEAPLIKPTIKENLRIQLSNTEPPTSTINTESPIQNPNPSMFKLNEAFKFSLPIVLEKVFKMALRKSMVSVKTNAKCKTGAATFTDCNVCFCVNDFKLLCTSNPCQ